MRYSMAGLNKGCPPPGGVASQPSELAGRLDFVPIRKLDASVGEIAPSDIQPREEAFPTSRRTT